MYVFFTLHGRMEKEHIIIIEHILEIITSLWSTSFHLRIAKNEILTVSYYWEIWVRNNTLAAQLKKPHLLRPMPQWCHATKFRCMTNVVPIFFSTAKCQCLHMLWNLFSAAVAKGEKLKKNWSAPYVCAEFRHNGRCAPTCWQKCVFFPVKPRSNNISLFSPKFEGSFPLS